MKEITVLADTSRLEEVQQFIRGELKGGYCDEKTLFQLDLVVEEIFVNISHYAYEEKKDEATITCEIKDNPRTIIIKFIDSGKEYNPFVREDPDITLDAKSRQIGGLGVFITKKMVDSLDYFYKDGKNCLILKKII
ncbi:MAG: ATP-binding protein [Oscillospiraceae bacterium]|jgi:anti-sigma regulatory factor (Ser/Thr protein kinase)|nr:ATP-binding protein [Oscillospiraceae bacterium]